ncbi:MAG: hypothetical protein M5U26_06390 [Planctomycetota bacterium]|nr:hypothetical protein [Planctomycetota bacterium]
MRRSEPGLGRLVGLYFYGSPGNDPDKPAMCFWISSIGEDFADSASQIVLKVKPEVTKDDLIKHLKELVKTLERSALYQQIDPDTTVPGQES